MYKNLSFAFSLKTQAPYRTDCKQIWYHGVVRIPEGEMTLSDLELWQFRPFQLITHPAPDWQRHIAIDSKPHNRSSRN